MQKIIVSAAVAALVMVTFTIAIGIVSLCYAFPVKWLWNYAAVGVFGVHSISFWQSLALLVLCGLLFRSSASTQKKEEK